MDIAALSMNMSTSKLVNQVSTAVLSKSLDIEKKMGDGIVKMMESSVTPHLGQNLDVTA